MSNIELDLKGNIRYPIGRQVHLDGDHRNAIVMTEPPEAPEVRQIEMAPTSVTVRWIFRSLLGIGTELCDVELYDWEGRIHAPLIEALGKACFKKTVDVGERDADGCWTVHIGLYLTRGG